MKEIYIIHQCMFCENTTYTKAQRLRDHILNFHGIQCQSTCKERRKNSANITFTIDRSKETIDCFGCCYCASYFTDLSLLKHHIIEIHISIPITDQAENSSPLRIRKYKVTEVKENVLLTEKSTKWVVDNIDVSTTLYSFRDQIIRMNEDHKPLSDTEILVLDYIFVFGKEQEKISVTCFSLENYRQVVNDILYLKIENIIPKSSLVNKWCDQLSNGNVFSWRDVKLKTIPMLYEAIQSTNEDDLLAADIIHNLAGRILDNPDRKIMLEDSFAHKYLDVILETIFGSERRFKQDWANGSLLGNKRKLECLDSSNDEENDNDNENQNILYKPDWLVYTKSWRTKAVLGVMELKVAYKRNPSLISDFVKLGREMKLTLNELIYRGIKNPMVCGILIEGFECQTFVMDLNYDGIYRLSAISKFKLCCNIQEFVLFPTLFNNILYLKKLIMEVALQVEKCDLDRQLGKEIEGSIPLHWIRPMVGSIKRL